MSRSPFLAPDAEARALLRGLIDAMRHAVLSVADPAQGFPHMSRIAMQPGADGLPLALLSEIATHSRLLHAEPRAALLIEAAPASRGDAMTQARASLQVIARPLPPNTPEHAARIARWLELNPKAAAYARLPDFRFWQFLPQGGFLNAGFGRAYRLQAADIAPM